MFQLRIEGTDKVLKLLERAARDTPAIVTKGLHDAGVYVKNAAQKNFLSNQVLHVRSGNLQRSIVSIVRAAESVSIGTNIVYARIHELGGRTSAHVIVPRNAKALAWKSVGGYVTKSGNIKMFYGGKSKAARRYGYTYAMRVNHPGSVIPKRPWLLPAYESQRERITDRFQKLLEGNLR